MILSYCVKLAYNQTWANTSSRFVIRLNFAALLIIRVWTYKKFPRIIQYLPDSNTYFKIWLLQFVLRESVFVYAWWYSSKFKSGYYSCFVCTQIWILNIELWLNLDTTTLIFDWRTNLEAGPRFADICCSASSKFLYLLNYLPWVGQVFHFEIVSNITPIYVYI